MREDTIHRLDGVGRQIIRDRHEPFNPHVHELAVHGLQNIILSTRMLEDNGEYDDYGADHVKTEAEGLPVFNLDKKSVLKDVCMKIPLGWDISILCDKNREDSYALRMSKRSGRGVVVYVTGYLDEGTIQRLDFGHTMVADRSRHIEKRLSPLASAGDLNMAIRYLERTVMEGYAQAINSAATAFDYIGTKGDIAPRGPHDYTQDELFDRPFQTEWATIRDKTDQTVSNNVSSARSDLPGLPSDKASHTASPALEQIGEDAEPEGGDVRLV